jgi:class 3 adenylate cyclase
MDIGGWLRRLGLQRYEQAFRENEIDLRVLPELTADDLKELGVAAIGHRRLLLKAIADLAADAGRAATEDVPATSRANATAEAERRQLTVMFCDLVGSTALSTRHDPEDLRELIGPYHRCVAETVGRFDGFVAKYMGDGVLIYFGYPQAHEDDAERAVRAGLAVIEAVGRLPAQEDLRLRLGIATGLAVVGDLIGEGAAQERGVVGETPNLAARLQALAAPNTVVIGEATRRQIGGLFDLADLGPQALAGFAEPQPAWRVIGESGVLSRFEALRSGTTPFVGRSEELDLLLRRWEQAQTGEGRVVLISGEPGIGKSRLTAALNEHIGDEPHTRLRYFCSPHHQDSALYPFIAQLERATGYAHDDGPELKLEKFAALLGPAAKTGDISLLAELMSLPGGERFPPLDLSPQRKKERTLAALLRQFEGLARQQPVLMIFEDLHWIDPTSRELLDLTIEGIDRLPVLLVATFRPEFRSPWARRSQVTVIALNRLRRSDGVAMVQRLAANAALADDTIAEIVERTDGVPLFVEELTKAVLESAGRGDRVAAVLATTSSAALSVPATLHASLVARLDRLGPAPREIAQIGAVLGREFTYELIELVAGRRPDLDVALGQLTDAGLLFCRGIPPQSSYLFKHALVQDAAYSTLLRGRRQELHGRVAAALEQHFADLVERHPELLAWHLTEAGFAGSAVEYWSRAGERAVEHSANLEAIAHLTRGIELLQTLPESPERDDRELGFQAALVAPHWHSKGWASPGAERAAARAFELCQGAGGDTAEHFTALFGLAVFYMVRGQLRVGRELGAQALALSERLGDETLLGYGHFIMGDFLLWFGESAAARAHLEHGLALWQPERDKVAAARFGFANGVACRAFLGRALWYLGLPRASRKKYGSSHNDRPDGVSSLQPGLGAKLGRRSSPTARGGRAGPGGSRGGPRPLDGTGDPVLCRTCNGVARLGARRRRAERRGHRTDG